MMKGGGALTIAAALRSFLHGGYVCRSLQKGVGNTHTHTEGWLPVDETEGMLRNDWTGPKQASCLQVSYYPAGTVFCCALDSSYL